MIVADTSALISLASGTALKLFLDEFDVAIARTVVEELKGLSGGTNRAAEDATEILQARNYLGVRDIESELPVSSRVDEGEASCVILAKKLDVDYLVTDDLWALPEIESMVGKDRIAISPLVLQALVKRGALKREEAVRKLELMAEGRHWLHRPIYEKARRLMEE